jgi:hypothetical protein
MAVALTLCDRSDEMVRAWQRYFPLDLGVRIVKGEYPDTAGRGAGSAGELLWVYRRRHRSDDQS